MVRRFLPPSLVLLAGCVLSPPLFAPATPIEVQVPVYEPVYCTPPALVNPQLPIAALTPAALPADTLRAYASSVVLLKGAVRELDSIVQGCAAPAPANAVPPVNDAPAGPAPSTTAPTLTGATIDAPPSTRAPSSKVLSWLGTLFHSTAASAPTGAPAPPDLPPSGGAVADSIRLTIGQSATPK